MFFEIGYAGDYASLDPISWESLQVKEIDVQTQEIESSLSNQCPHGIDSYRNYKYKGVYYSYIFFINYYWTEYLDETGKKCIIKHSKFDILDSELEFLSYSQSLKLLKANELYGFNYETKIVLNIHIMLHKNAIKELPALKYGGYTHISNYLKTHSPEFQVENKQKQTVDVNGHVVIQTMPVIDYFESSFSKDTLNSIAENIKKSPPNRISNGKYPFRDVDELIKEAKNDVKKGLLSLEEILMNY